MSLVPAFWKAFWGPFNLFLVLLLSPFVVCWAFINRDPRSVKELFTRPS